MKVFALASTAIGADAVDRHQEIRPLDVGAVRGGNGERRLIEIEVGKPRAVEPVLQGALPALPLLYSTEAGRPAAGGGSCGVSGSPACVVLSGMRWW